MLRLDPHHAVARAKERHCGTVNGGTGGRKVASATPTPSGPAYDYGKGHAVGAGYLYLVGFPPQQPFFWGVGGDARLFIEEGNGIAGAATSGVARVTAGHAPPVTLEISAGGLFSSQQAGGVASAGDGRS